MRLKMAKIKSNFKSVRFKLFFTMCLVIALIVLCLVVINSVVLRSFYLYSKIDSLKNVYAKINNYYNSNSTSSSLDEELRRIAFNNNYDIFIRTESNMIVFSTDKDLYSAINILSNANKSNNEIVLSDGKIQIKKIDTLYIKLKILTV